MFATLFHRDWSVRLAGIATLVVGAIALERLFDAPATGAGIVLAAGGFLACTTGAALTLLGAHVHDRIAVARPWGGQPFFDQGRSSRRLHASRVEPAMASGSREDAPADPWAAQPSAALAAVNRAR